MAVSEEIAETLRIGVDCCRRGDWNQGLRYLGQIAEKGESAGSLPGVFYSYLGYGIAMRDRRVREGLKLCKHAIQVEFYQGENYVNLARTCMLARDRKGAVRAVRDGLKVDRNNKQLLVLYKEMGIRKQPVLPFLDRAHFLNQWLGRLRHALRGGGDNR